MFGYFHVTLNFNSVYMYGVQCSIALLTILDVEQNILRLPTFHCICHKKNCLSKYKEK